jgi:tetratricopeptide (TPR) repeat protein
MNRILFFLFWTYLLAACSNKKFISDPPDYNAFLIDESRIERETGKVRAEIEFWQNRLARDTGSFVDMLELASQHSRRFSLSGDVLDLHKADSFYQRCLEKVKHTEPEIYFSLSQNAITKHRFRQAWQYLQQADSIGVNPYFLHLLKFDAAMELGLYQEAFMNLEQVKNKNAFDYLVRKAKFEDHNGRPGTAMELMQQALMRAESSGKKSWVLWTKSNLADMYGHAGRVKKAYKNYLEVLKTDSSYLYALKGIAWIAYSHDHNTKEARRILNYILSQTNMPDLWLMLAEIAEWENDTTGKIKYISRFLSEAEMPAYENMYNKYLITIYTTETNEFDRALALAQEEVSSRPTPETYSWLAWTYYKKGDTAKAARLINDYVLDKTFEPDVLLHAAFILKANGNRELSRELFNKCLAASFELGPVAAAQIKQQLAGL